MPQKQGQNGLRMVRIDTLLPALYVGTIQVTESRRLKAVVIQFLVLLQH